VLTRTSKVALRAWTAKALLCLPFMLGVKAALAQSEQNARKSGIQLKAV